jgi:putative transposase
MPYVVFGHRLMCRHAGINDAGGMARLPRFDIAGTPQHIVQRGNNRLPCFLDDDDRRRYLSLLSDALIATGCQLHAYVLMDNHTHLLVTPDAPGAVSLMMQRLGRRYVAEFNRRHGRTGTLWEGRFKSSLVESDGYVLACYRYIELNPVRARMVSEPEVFRWSSHAGNALGRADPLLTPHPCYYALAGEPQARSQAYRAIVRQVLSDDEIDRIRLHLQQQRALGSDDFRSMVEAKVRRFAGVRPAHRPRLASNRERK